MALSVTHTVTTSYRSGAGSVSGISPLVYVGDSELNTEVTIPAGSVDFQIDLDFQATDIVSMLMYSSQAVTVETNNGTTPADTINLAAKSAVHWGTGHPQACPITTAVTSLYVTNSGASDADFKFYVLLDNA